MDNFFIISHHNILSTSKAKAGILLVL